MVVVELFFEDEPEMVGGRVSLCRASCQTEGLAYPIDELRVLDGGEWYLAKGFVQDGVSLCGEAFIA